MQRFYQLPSVLIQDPRVGCAYLIDSQALANYEMSSEKLVHIDHGVVTFSIPDNELIEATPPFNASGTGQPTVIIQHLARNKSYFLTYDQLQAYRIEQPSDYGGYGISFVIPSGNEFLEDLSPVQYAMLQSGESGSVDPFHGSPNFAKNKESRVETVSR
ncbi:MAG: hypothetical protein V6Z86_01750 [Hyphomicrobiales bacterium]